MDENGAEKGKKGLNNSENNENESNENLEEESESSEAKILRKVNEARTKVSIYYGGTYYGLPSTYIFS